MASTSNKQPKSGRYDHVECIAVDDFVSHHQLIVSAVKFDLEGHERFVLRGMAKLLASQKPRLAIFAYHLPDDIPILTKTIL